MLHLVLASLGNICLSLRRLFGWLWTVLQGVVRHFVACSLSWDLSGLFLKLGPHSRLQEGNTEVDRFCPVLSEYALSV